MRLKGGIPVGPDGRSHGYFQHQPSTLRLSMAGAPLHQIPRGSTELAKLVRRFFVAPDGYTFWARDFSGIEAVLVGFFANAERIMRIFRLDGHSYFTAYALYELDKSIKFEDLPQESWPDDQLAGALAEIKKAHKPRRETNKKITHGANYIETAPMAQVILLNELGILYPIKEISRVMEFYHELFPEIRKWHRTMASEIGGVELGPNETKQRWGFKAGPTWVQNPFGAAHRYYNAIRWEKTPQGWQWVAGEDLKRAVSFLPQSTARFIKTRAGQRIWEHYPDVAKTLRLFIHDEIFGECKEGELARCLQVSQIEQERPVPELVLPNGSFLRIGSEAKSGKVWGDMR